MPGRTSTRSTRSARSSAGTTTTTTTTTRKSAGRGRSSAANVEIPDEGPEISIRTEIGQIFNDAQNTTATQRKLQTMLRKIQERCSYEQVESKSNKKAQQDEQLDEQDFNNEVVRCLLRVLNVKKGVQEGDRVIKFLGLFVKNASEKGKFPVAGTCPSQTNGLQTARYTKETLRMPRNCLKHPPAASPS
jgi:condensin complex subunit 3